MPKFCARAKLPTRLRQHLHTNGICMGLADLSHAGQTSQTHARIKKSVGGHFAGMILTIHPDPLRDYPDGDGPEIRGKASNYRWAAKEVDDFVRDNRIPAENCIVTVADYDSLFDPNHFPYMTYEFCTRDDVDLCVWQPCMMPTLNFWMIYPGVRLVWQRPGL